MWRMSCSILLLLAAWSRSWEVEAEGGVRAAWPVAAFPGAGGEREAGAEAGAAAEGDAASATSRLRRAATSTYPGLATTPPFPTAICHGGACRDWHLCPLPWAVAIGLNTAAVSRPDTADDSYLNILPREDKRSLKFNPWGGKREQLPASKPRKAYFSPWGGKRAVPVWESKRASAASGVVAALDRFPDDLVLSNDEDSEAKRTFHSWGGKRVPEDAQTVASLPEDTQEPAEFGVEAEEAVKRGPAFHSWGGKRHAMDSRGVAGLADAGLPRISKRKTKFYPWGGKRSANADADADQSAGDASVLRRNGADFYPWGGKRALPVA